MPGKMTAAELLDGEFLEMRCRLLDVAAALGRIDAGMDGASVASDPRLASLREAAAVLIDGQGDRARRVQMVFSDSYDPDWRTS